MKPAVIQGSRPRSRSEWPIRGGILLAWFIVLCFVPDPRPLGAPEWSVHAARALTGTTEPTARALATLVLRAFGFGVIGVLASLALSSAPVRRAAPIALVAAPSLAVVSQWINHGHFPITMQIQLAVASAVVGALVGLAIRRSLIAVGTLVVVVAGLYLWGTSTRVSDDLDFAARVTGQHLLAKANEIPSGDDGFSALLQSAFSFAEDNSHRTGAVFPNAAAILALGVILGEERVATAARRRIEPDRLVEIDALRRRITLRGRNDLARHFWVSAALVVLADRSRSKAVGVGKELMDATPGGSGFSFVDLAANLAGIRFAEIATRSQESAHEMQMRVMRGMQSSDFSPDIDDLPEGLTRDQFQAEFGGLGGAETRRIVEEIQRRLDASAGLAR